jgi:acyl carrier protein
MTVVFSKDASVLPEEAVLERLRPLVLHLCDEDEPEIRSETRFEELGLDSVDRLELLVAIEDAFGVALGDEHLATPTVGCVADAILNGLKTKGAADDA